MISPKFTIVVESEGEAMKWSEEVHTGGCKGVGMF